MLFRSEKGQLLRSAARHADLLPLQRYDGLQGKVGAADDPHASLREAGHDVDGRPGGAPGDGRVESAGGNVDLPRDDAGDDVQPLGENLLVDLQVVLRRDLDRKSV